MHFTRFLPIALLAIDCASAERLAELPAALALRIEQQTDTSLIDFENVPVGVSATRQVTVTDSGSGVLVLKNVAQIGDPVFTVSPLPTSLQPGASATFTVTFAPAAETTYAGALTFASNDPKQANVSIGFGGVGGNPVLVVCVGPTDVTTGANCTDQGRVVDFKKSIAEDALETIGKTRAVRMIATTNSDVVIKSVTLTGDTQAFTVNALNAEMTIPGNSDAYFDVTFLPPAAGDFSAQLTIASNDGLAPDVVVQLKGSGAKDCSNFNEAQTQTQTPLQKIDVLFVIDTTGQMGGTQSSMLSQINAFFEQLALSNMDVHAAVTTMDMVSSGAGNKGTLIQGPSTGITVVASDDPPPDGVVAGFQDLMSAINTFGNGTQLGMLATLSAVTPAATPIAYAPGFGCTTLDCSGSGYDFADCPASASGQRNAAFWRDDARLALVMISDEDDGGTGRNGDATDPATYAVLLRSLAQAKLSGTASADLYLRVAAIVDPGNGAQGCASSNASCLGVCGTCYAGTPRWHALISALGDTQGLLIDYCSNIQQSLTQSGAFIGAATCFFDLEGGIMTVDPSDSVSVGGTLLAQNQWSYLTPSAGHPNGQVEIISSQCPATGGNVLIDYDSCLRSYDFDGDGVPDLQDNCPCDKNADQSDQNNDGIGDVCQNEVDPLACL